MKNPNTHSGIFNPRVLVAFTFCAWGILLAMLSFGATPPNRTATPADLLMSNEDAATSGTLSPAPNDTWSIISSPNAGQGDSLNGVTCLSASDCWAVGSAFSNGPHEYDGTSSQTLIEHWDGTSWIIVSSPNGDATHKNSLWKVACPSASDCWAVGQYYTSLTPNSPWQSHTLIEHWDGTSWAIVRSPDLPSVDGTEQGALASVTCTSASNCWAVGFYRIKDIRAGNSYTLGYQTLTEHWDGTEWTIVSSPSTLPVENNYLNAVTCASASDCWAVGSYDDRDVWQTLTEHWDGTQWSIVSSPSPGGLTVNNILQGVTCTSSSNCWAVGGTGRYLPLIERWDGTSWAVVTSPDTFPFPTQFNLLNNVTCASASECWAVGYYQASSDYVYQTLIEKWDGTSWAIVSSPNNSTAKTHLLYGATCVSQSDCWGVGTYYQGGNSGAAQTLTLKYSVLPVQLSTVESRMTHGSAGTFDINLPLTGSPGIEPRSGGANGNYTLIFTFANPLTTVDGASVTSGTGSATGNIDPNDAHNYIVNLTGVTNAQMVTVSLTNVHDSTGNFSSAVNHSLRLLVGDTTGDGNVNSADIAQTKSQSGQAVTASNFREDVTADGNATSADIALVKSKSGTGLPQ